MSVKRPTVEDFARIAQVENLKLTPEQIEVMTRLMGGLMATYDRIDELPEPAAEVKYPNRRNWRPTEKENPFGAWYWRSEIKGAEQGALAGRKLAITDNICVAGLPMMNGSRLLEGFIPKSDATVVTRILEAGGTILGKAVCENLCFSGNSHTSDSGIVRNPWDPARSPGGSSTGCAALLASGQVDMAMGGDQAGSIRIPGSWSGIFGLKPTWGLVPYTGICPMEFTIDHTGPMARTAAEVAQLLEVIAGPDGLDPRQRPELAAQKYAAALTGEVKGMRIGVVREGFGLPGASQKDVDEAVRESAYKLAGLGCTVGDVSIPWHRDGFFIWAAIGYQGTIAFVVDGDGAGRHWKGCYPTDLIQYFSRAVHERPWELPLTVKMALITDRYIGPQSRGRFYAKGQNLARALTAAYDEALGRFDVLVMPTTPSKAAPIPSRDGPLEPQLVGGIDMLANTSPFDATGHPALTVPCAVSEGLPVGMMLVGRMGDEATVLKIADAFQRRIYTIPSPPHRA